MGGTPLLHFYSLWHGSRVHNPEDEEEDDQNQESGRQVLGLIHFALVSFTRVSLQINFDWKFSGGWYQVAEWFHGSGRTRDAREGISKINTFGNFFNHKSKDPQLSVLRGTRKSISNYFNSPTPWELDKTRDSRIIRDCVPATDENWLDGIERSAVDPKEFTWRKPWAPFVLWVIRNIIIISGTADECLNASQLF